MPRMTAAEIARLCEEHHTGVAAFVTVEEVTDDLLRLRVPYRPEYARAGGTIAGPILVSAADAAVYFLVLAHVGAVIDAFTTSIDVHFLRRPAPRDVICHARLLKLGKRIAVGDVLLYSDGDPELVAQANVTYALPSGPSASSAASAAPQ